MSKGRYHYYDPEFNAKLTQGNEMLISLTLNTFSFLILQTDSKKVLIWGQGYPLSELQTPDELKAVLTATYDAVKVAITSDSFSIIPNDLYYESEVPAYSKFLSAKPDDTILTTELDNNNHIIYKIAEDTADIITAYTEIKNVFFAGKVMITALNVSKPDSTNFYGHVEDNELQLFYFKDDLLRFYNRFQFNNSDELMYYIVLAANSLELDLNETALVLSGDVNLSDRMTIKITELLPKVYLNQTQVVTMPPGFLPHEILMLAGLTLCASLVEN